MIGTAEEAQIKGIADIMANNSLSSVKIYRGAKGVTWDISVKHENAIRAGEIAQEIDARLKERYA